MKALAVLLYSMGKSSFRWLGKLFKVAHTSVYKWIILYAKRECFKRDRKEEKNVI
ncbi:hypothetical protein [Candidatus Bandiella euplotis]|uniref:hypothetical protein n=1 Tax=Candidatus Bandiella euplotis TaxID=1664265 RepID=UPI002B25CF32|nr:hypothetical protein [Candidatus Bandiella woodruffii]